MAVVAAMEAKRGSQCLYIFIGLFSGWRGSLSALKPAGAAACLRFTVVAPCCPWSIAGLVPCVSVERAPDAGVCYPAPAVKSGLLGRVINSCGWVVWAGRCWSGVWGQPRLCLDWL